MKVQTLRSLMVFVVMGMIGFATSVLAAPNTPDILTISDGERRAEQGSGGFAVEAQAGNVTQLFVNDTRVTLRWQGYYGNVTGAITLDDASNNTLYDWNIASPQGEIFASNGSGVTWGNIDCFNFTGNHSGMNLTTIEDMIGAGYTDIDGVDETFNETFSGSLNVGGVTLGSGPNLCPLTYLYVDDEYQTTDFQEVILTDNSSVIYTSILEQDATGFDGSSWDFQMIVGEDGDVTTSTTYYFYVELT